LIIEGIDDDDDLTISLGSLKQIYLSFDDLFPMFSARGLGVFWQPLRVEFYRSVCETQSVYLIIDFNGIYTHDKEWFKALKDVLG